MRKLFFCQTLFLKLYKNTFLSFILLCSQVKVYKKAVVILKFALIWVIL